MTGNSKEHKYQGDIEENPQNGVNDLEEGLKESPSNTKEDVDEDESYKYPLWLKLLCYFTGLIAFVFICYVLSGIPADIFEYILKKFNINKTISKMDIYLWFSGIFTLTIISKHLGDSWRSNERAEIGTSVTNFRNFFYDPNFKVDPTASEYAKLRLEYRYQRILVNRAKTYAEKLENNLLVFESQLRVLLRHNDNVNRLIGSYNFFIKEQEDFVNRLISNTLSECVTVLQRDQSDKSISLFEVKDQKLIIRDYLRISALSAATRSFNKGEGFAGYIWEKNKTDIVDVIDIKHDKRFADFEPRHRFKSIVGIPLSIEDNIFGVLCIQSENEYGFSDSDLRTLEFYARLCTLLLQYDKINNNRHGGRSS
jgi:putative methionine-R-sulfoxide reductase with GAF domain